MRISKFGPSLGWPAVATLALVAASGSGRGPFVVQLWAAEPGERVRQRAEDSLDKQLDEQLLEDLRPSLNERPAGRGPADQGQEPASKRISNGQNGKSESGKPSSQPARNMDEELLEGLEGEDVSLSSNPADENPLIRLNQRMKQVERRIAETRGGEKTQRLQHDISDDLSKLIAALDRQCRQSKKPTSGSSRSQAGQPKPTASPDQQPSERPAQDSSDRIEEKETAKVDRAKMQEMLKDVWGHLPMHLRQQMEQSANEEFLPKYELEIAEYYRSLLSGRREKK